MKQNLILLTIFLTAFSVFSMEYFVDAFRPDDTGAATNWATAKRTIQAAVDLAVDGDTVWVTNGVYDAGGRVASESLLTNRVCITKAITLQSINGPGATIIEGAADSSITNGPMAVRCVYLSSGAVLNGFTLKNGHTDQNYTAETLTDVFGGGLLIFGNAKADRCILNKNSASLCGGGAYFYNGGELSNCLLTENDSDRGGGAYVFKSGILSSCTVSENNARLYGGVEFYNGGYIRNCIVWGNGSGDDINLYSGASASYVCSEPLQAGEGNIAADPQFVDAPNGNYRLKSTSPCVNVSDISYTPSYFDLDGNPRVVAALIDMGTYESEYLRSQMITNFLPSAGSTFAVTNTVCFSAQGGSSGNAVTFTNLLGAPVIWLNPTTIQFSAIGSVCIVANQDGGPFHYPAGSVTNNYTVERASQEITEFLPESQSAFLVGETISLSAQGGGSGNPIIFSKLTGPPVIWVNTTTLQFFAIGEVYIISSQEGSERYSAAPPVTNRYMIRGVGIYYVDAAKPDDNGNGTSWGSAKKTIQSAVDIAAAGSTVWVTDGIYDTGGAITPGYALFNRVCIRTPIEVRSVNGPNATVIKGAFDPETETCGPSAVRCVYLTTNATLSGFTLTNGYTRAIGDKYYDRAGGGVLLCTNATVSRCKISGNRAKTYGGGAFFYQGGRLINCLLIYNSAGSSGGGAYTHLSGSLLNCTLVSNAVPTYGGGVSFYVGGSISNSILWGNSGTYATLYMSGGGAYTYDYNCSSAWLGWDRGHVIDTDPLFIDAANGDFRLQSNSPCINAGNNITVSTTNDLDGNPRIIGAVVDIGAYEYQDSGTDADADGMNDLWELNQFGGRHFAEPDTICSNGVNTLRQAYIAGLDPKNPQSRFQTSVFRSLTSGNELQWQGVSGRVYAVYYSTNLIFGFQPLETNIPWSVGCFTDTVHNANGQLFYKLDVRLED